MAADLAALHARCFSYPRPWSAAEFEALLRAPATFLIVCAGGFALGRAVADEAELLTLAVATELRRQAVGRALVEGFEAEAGTRGAADAFLEVAADNVAAIALYTAAGYVRRGVRPGYVRRPDATAVDALTLGKRLSPT